jgi:putative ABC transport system permease protein
MRIPIRRGRNFTPQEVESGAPVVLIDETLARRFWPHEDALGKHILYDSATGHEVIGIVSSLKTFVGETSPRGRIFTPLNRAALPVVSLALRSPNADGTGLVAAVTHEVHALDNDLPVSDVATMEQLLAREVSPRRFNTILLGLFAAVALALAAVGIYGVMAYSVTQRTHEIGIRLALGAEPRDVLRLILRHGIWLTLTGVVIGLAAAFALTRVMSSLLYEVSATDPATFAVIPLLLAGVALLATYLPARRAMKVDPIVALRHE